MDPKESRSRSPSLLDADAHEVPSPPSSERILSGLQGESPRAAAGARPRRWLWPSALLLVGLAAVLLLVLGGAFDGSGARSPTRVAEQAEAVLPPPGDAPAEPPAVVPAGTGGDDVADAAHEAAVILPGEAAPAVSATAALPASAASSSKDAVALSEIFTPPSERKPAAVRRPAVRRAAGNGDSDVALLTALIRHVEVGDPAARKQLERISHARAPAVPADSIEARMQACPAANTEAGLRCRQRLCAGHSGESTACPAAATDGA